MPYIQQPARDYFSTLLKSLQYVAISDPGELNYLFTEVLKKYIETHDLNYKTMNDVVGALECCKQEFYRRMLSPYEDRKQKLNGDVYE